MLHFIDLSDMTPRDAEKVLKKVIRTQWPQDEVIYDKAWGLSEDETDYLASYFNTGWRWERHTKSPGAPLPGLREYIQSKGGHDKMSEHFWHVIAAAIFTPPHSLRYDEDVLAEYKEMLLRISKSNAPLHAGFFCDDLYVEDFVVFKMGEKDPHSGYLYLVRKGDVQKLLDQRRQANEDL